MVRRLFVEKMQGFDIEAKHVLSDIRDSLGLNSIQSMRLFNRYDVDGLNDDEYEKAKFSIFSEPNVDCVYDTRLPADAGDFIFAVEYLPGQYDQRADSAAQCIQLLTKGERPEVRTARVYAFSGSLTGEEQDKIKSFLVNPVEARAASDAIPESLHPEMVSPADIPVIEGFIHFSDEDVEEYHKEIGFAMSVADLCFCRDYFMTEGRDPYLTELKVIDTYWSDHCRHTTFLTKLEEIEIEEGSLAAPIRKAAEAYFAARREVYGQRDKPVSLMDIATMGMRLLKKRGLIPDLDESDEINACSIEVPVTVDGKEERWLVQFKNETHNHPTEIEPFGGAATCLGGAIRDPLSGRAYVYQAMRVTGSADPTRPFHETLPGKLPQKKITTGAAHGYSSYGNQIGLATGQVAELYDEGYAAKRLEIGAVVGASPKVNVVRGCPEAGDIIVLLGGRTGRDGCGGATGSSKAHDISSIETCGAEVQKGNPPTERKLQRLFRNPEAARLIKRCNDFGAGGVCVAIGELADSLEIELDRVPKKYEGLDGTELAISESQERMAVVLDAQSVDTFIRLADAENLEATPVAKVTASGRLRMIWRGSRIVDLSRDFLNTNGVTQRAKARIRVPDPARNYRGQVPPALLGLPLKDAFLKNLARLQVCSQKGLCERFDASIGAGSVLMPFSGRYQQTPENAMVAKIPLTQGETDDATAMSFGFLPGLTKWSPFHGSAFAVVESLSKLAAAGADPLKARLTFQEYFERLYDDPARWGKPAAALLGAFAAQTALSIPSIGGKDSMSGSFGDLDVPPTLVSFALTMTKASETGSAELKSPGSKIVLLPLPCDEEQMPDFPAIKILYQKITELVKSKQLKAVSVVSEGGAAAAVAKMAFGNGIGVRIDETDLQVLFAPISGSFVAELEDLSLLEGLQYIVLGETISEPRFIIGGEAVDLFHALEVWSSMLEPVFPQRSDTKVPMEPEVPIYTARTAAAPSIKIPTPRVLIPVFPGTNCEVDTARVFEKAGAEVDLFVLRNLTPAAIVESIEVLERKIRNAQIIMLPGGFSGGDEPDGSGKFIATTFRSPGVRDAVTELLQHRDGLMLGICNGFQALIKLGLVPYGEITDQKLEDPTLTFNTLGRHVSRMVYTRVTSVKSPWLAGCEAGEIHTIPVSHGEGRFVASPEILETLVQQGQIATQYVDLSGSPSGDIAWNPNGSGWAVEGITSPDGRVFGKMGHSERIAEHAYKNVPGNKDQRIFESGVAYFR